MTMLLENVSLVCFMQIPGGDLLASIEPLADGAKFTFRFRWYDPDEPHNDAFSGKDTKSWYNVSCKSLKDARRMLDLLIQGSTQMGAGPAHIIERGPTESFESFFDRFKDSPFVHTKTESLQ